MTEKEWNQMVFNLVPLAFGAASLSLGLMALTRTSSLGRRIYSQDGQYLVAVRYPGQWHDLKDFIQPDDPAVLDIYRETGPDVWRCLDWVCRSISYRRDLGEWWSFPSETVKRGDGDCEDTSFLLASLIRNFSNAYVALGDYQGYGHAWCQLNGEILETTYTRAGPVPDPEHYVPFVLFNDQEVIELWPGALEDIFSLRRNEATKLNLMAEAIGNEVPPECPSCWPLMVVCLVTGGVLGTGFAMILQKDEEARWNA